MNIKAKINELAGKIKSDGDLLKKFQASPAAVVEELLGISLPKDQVDGVVNGIKAKLTVGKGKDLLGKVGGLFKK